MVVSVCKRYLNFNFTQTFVKSWTQFVKFKSDVHVVMTDDCSTVVCWHPEKSFPYEMTKPIPEKVEIKTDSVLKIQSNKELLSLLKPKRQEEVIKELTSITYTTKHIWYPPKNQFRRKKRAEMDRPYL